MKWISCIFLIFFLISCKQLDTESILNTGDNKRPNKPNTELPKCDSLCPNDTKVLKGNTGFWNFLSFENFGYRGIGRCRGHAIISQKFAELSEFESGSLCNDPDSSSCLLHLKLGIAKILNFEVFKFIGFNSLYELTKHPYVKKRLIEEVRSISHRYNATQAVIADSSYDTLEISIFYEIIRRLKNNQQPYIGIKGTSVGHHALLAYDYKYDQGQEVICVRDSNLLPFESGESCRNKLFIKDSEVHYFRQEFEKHEKLVVFTLMSDEDLRVSKYIESRKNYCLNIAKTKKLCVN